MPKSFTDTLNALRAGTLADELTDKLAELTTRCADTGRNGAITITLTLKPGKAGQVEIFDDIKLKLPKEERGSSLMWATPEGSLVRDDPRQKKLDLREVASPQATTMVNVNRDTGELRDVATTPVQALRQAAGGAA